MSHLRFALVLLVLGGCTTQERIDTEIVPSADFSQRHTFAWQESQASYSPEAATAQDAQTVKSAIQDAVLAQLAGKGYALASTAAPDFLVSFHLVVTEFQSPDLCVRRQAIFELPGTHSAAETYEVCRMDPVMSRRTLRKGTLVVFVVDAESRNLLWQAVADGGVSSRQDQIDKLRAAIARMFVTFPTQTA